MERHDSFPSPPSISPAGNAPWQAASRTLTAAVDGAILVSWVLGLVAVGGMIFRAQELAAPPAYPFAIVFGFLSAGAGLRFAAVGRTVSTMILGALVVASGLLFLVEHGSLGGEWTLRHAPCAVTKALCLVLTGAAIGLLGLRAARGKGTVLAGILGAAAAALGLGELAGHLIEQRLIGDAGSTPVALWTFGGLAVLGAGTVALASREAGHALRARAPRWLAMAVATFLAMGALGLWQALRVEEERRLEKFVEREAAAVAARVTELLDRDVRALERMGRRWEQNGGTPLGQWKVDAGYHLLHGYGYQAIDWVDPSFTVRWSVQSGSDEEPLGNQLTSDEGLRLEFQEALEGREPAVSPPTELRTGGKGYYLVVPIHVEGRPDGFIVGELRAGRLLLPILGRRSSLGYSSAVLDGRHLVAGDSIGAPPAKRWMREVTIPVRNRRWRFRLWPTSERLQAELTAIPGVTLTASLAIACLVGFSIDRSGTARYRERKFRAFLESAPHAWVTVGTDGRIVQVNARAEKLFGYRRDELIGESVEMLLPERFQTSHPEQRRTYFRDPRPRPMGAGRILHACRKDGTDVPVEISLSPVSTDEGLLVLTAIVDVTHRIETARQLRSMNEKLERQVAERTAALEQRARELEQVNAELERFNHLAVGREHRMIALKRQVNELAVRLAEEPKYDLSFVFQE